MKRKQNSSKKLLSLILMLSLISGLVPINFGVEAAGTVTAVLRAQFVEAGNTAEITVTDGNGAEITDAAFQSQDSNIATVDANGTVTGDTIGKTTVTVTTPLGNTAVDVPVVGENLLTRQGVKNGEFQGGVYHSNETPVSTVTQYFWCNNYNTTGNYSYQQHSLLTNYPTYINNSTNVLKYTFGANMNNATRRDIRLQTFDAHYDGIAGNQYGTVPVNINKIYEYTGWIKAENTVTLANDIAGEIFYFNGPTYINNAYKNKKPWTDKSGDQDWTFFTVNAIPINIWNSGYDVGADVRINSTMAAKQGDLLVADLSFHEVYYDKLSFTAAIPEKLAVGTDIATTVKHYSNTGNEILSATSETGSAVPVAVTYESSNTAVATVSTSGVIKTVGPGSANITAAATIGGVTKTGTIAINIANTVSVLSYNYWKLSLASANNGDYDTWGNQATLMNTVTSLDMTTAGDPNEINKNSIAKTDPWCYVGVGGGTSLFKFIDYAYGLMFDKNAGAWARLKIHVTADGKYRAASVNGHWASGGIVRFYLAPDGAADPMAPEYSLGMIDTYAANPDWKREDKLGSRELTAGDYLLTYEILGKNAANAGDGRYAVGGFKLYATDTMPVMDVSADTLSTVKAGSTSESVLHSTMSDASGQDLFAACITAVPRDPSIATALVATSADRQKRSIQVTGIKEGSTIIDVAVSLYGNMVKTLTIPVTVEEGVLKSVELGIPDSASGRIALKTSHPLKLKLTDEDSAELPSGVADVTYQVEPDTVAAVTADGVLHALSNGSATVTATAVLRGVTKTASVDINVEKSGENLLADRNGSFEGDITANNWDWTVGYVTPASTDSLAQWTLVDTQEKDGNVANKALCIILNPKTVPNKYQTLCLNSNTNGRVKLQPGRLYELSAWIKTDNLTSPDGTYFACLFDIYDYSGASGSASAFPASLYRNCDFGKMSGYPDSFSSWKKITLPVAAPTDCGGELWVTSRLIIRHPNYSTITQTGYGGKYWIDDIELREVGFDRIEASTSGTPAAYGDKCAIEMTPYSTTNNVISILAAKIPDSAGAVSSDDSIVSVSAASAVSCAPLSTISSIVKIPSVTAAVGGKNGEAQVTASVSISGETRSAEVPFTFSNLPNIVKSVTLTTEKQEIECGQTMTTAVSGKKMDGTDADLDGAVIYYDSSDARIATVDENGIITAKSEGAADISVYIQIDGNIRTDKKTVSVIDSSALKTVSLRPSDISVRRFYTGQLSIDGVKESGNPANLVNAQIIYSITECNPAGAVDISSTGVIAGKLAGSAKVKAAVTLSGITVESAPITVTVTEKSEVSDVLIDFTANQSGTPCNATFESHGWRVNLDKTSAFVMTVNKGFRYQSYGIQSQINAINTERASDTAFDIPIPCAGYYTFSLRGGNYESGALAAVYIDGIYTGQYDFCNGKPNVPIGAVVTMNSIYLEAGVHTALIRSIGSTDPVAPGYSQYPGVLKFTAIDSLPTISEIVLNSSKSVMAIGERAVLTSKVLMSNGIPYQFGKLITGTEDPDNHYTVAVNDPTIVSVVNGTITALKAGIADITYTAVIKGEEVSKKISIQVNDRNITTVKASLNTPALYKGEVTDLNIMSCLDDGAVLDNSDVTYNYVTSDPNIFTVNRGKITATGVGSAQLTITATFRGISVTDTLPINVIAEGFMWVVLSAERQTMKPDSEGTKITVACLSNLGNEMDTTDAEINFSSDNTNVATADESGYVKPVGLGSALISAEVTLNGFTKTGDIYISVSEGKIGPSVYTADKIAAARENIQKYSWARSMKDAAVKNAEPYVGKENTLWELVPQEGLPRGITVGFINDPDAYTCRYCLADLMAFAGNYPWIVNPMSDPWKIQCPVCKRRFPSNDFGSFYKSGIDIHGKFQYKLALANGKEYLKNILYPEMGEGWGVDDGFGYKPGRIYSNGVIESHTYIAYYNHWGLWRTSGSNNPGVLITSLEKLRDAYLYTGDTKYGRVGAILIDRIADVYPDYDLLPYKDYYNSHGMSYRGKTIGCIWETGNAKSLALDYDAFYPMMDDQYVVNFLKNKAAKYRLVNTKATPSQIRENCENGILRSINEGCRTGKICGNFGMHQSAMATAAVVLDSMPETKNWIDWVFCPGTSWTDNMTGGNVLPQLVNTVSRDGLGNEAAPGYNNTWLSNTLLIAEALAGYKGYEGADLYSNPKFKKMFTGMFPLTIARRSTAQIGDSGATAGTGFDMNVSDLLTGFQRTGDPKIAKMLYFRNGNTASGLHADIFTKDPERIASYIQNIIDDQGEYDFDSSEQIPGYGFSILRGGSYYPSVGVNALTDTQRDFWFYYGGGTSHKHPDALNLGIEAYGLNMAPELGYPETAGPEPNRAQWINNTISHNTVIVNETKQASLTTNGNPIHFDDADRVKVMDAEAKRVYTTTDIYRRSVVMVEVNDEVSYGVDFFRVNGGNDHLYSFHSQSDEIYETQGIRLITQPIGSYAGPTVEWGENDKYLNGYSWLQNVQKAKYPGTGEFAVDFKVKDFRNILPYRMDLHLRMTMLNDFDLSEVSIAEGLPPRIKGNSMIPKLEFVLARRTGANLDTLFTTVFEPYNKDRYLEKLESVPATRLTGSESGTDRVKAVKVTHRNGRVDYIVYATNNQVKYRIDGVFDFRGFIGVYTLINGEPAYSYLNDGDIIGEKSGCISAVTGSVKDFTRELSSDNYITVTAEDSVNPDSLAGKFIYINNDGTQNAAYEIHGAKAGKDNTLVLDIGDTTLIREYKNSDDINGGYNYNITEGQSYRIPLSMVNDNSPIFESVGKKYVDARSQIKFIVNAASPLAKNLQFTAVTLPRGASFNPDTREFVWTPDSHQIGDNHVAITASDGILSTTEHYMIKVLGATGGSDNAIINNEDNSETNLKTDGKTEVKDNPIIGEKFTDLTDYEWAKDAILSLAEAGIIKGTGANTYSPEKSITRADFAVLLVRALKLSAGSEGNFDDVDSNAYYASDIAAAKANGIINGTGANLYQPAAYISRQDMMVITVRALNKAGVNLEAGSADTLADFSDVGAVADYAKEAVSTLVKNGIVTGSGGKLNPRESITRAEVAVILKRALDHK